jgi:simple sugar transport system substrate-binding protein
MSVEMNKNPNQLHDQSQQGLFSKLFSKFKKTAFCAASSGLLTIGALSTTATVVTTAHAADPLKAAFVYIGPPGIMVGLTHMINRVFVPNKILKGW